jgi:predicted Zn-dependent peptidase
MSSVLFQEIREFRSLAYYVSGEYILPPPCRSASLPRFVAFLSTQSDKTTDAIGALNALICDMPQRPERIPEVIQNIINQTINDYPSFRDLSSKINRLRRHGFSEDPKRLLIYASTNISMDDVARFHRDNLSGRTLVYVVVGNSRRINMRKLSAYGDVIRLGRSDFYR